MIGPFTYWPDIPDAYLMAGFVGLILLVCCVFGPRRDS
jgi:hypothetical protein